MVAFADVKDKLLTIDQAIERLEVSEPVSQTLISQDDRIRFNYSPEWASTVDAIGDDVEVEATITINDKEFPLTKLSALQAGSAFGIPATYAKRLPPRLLQEQLNYWYSAGMGEQTFNLLKTGANKQISAFAKTSVRPFSNIEFIERILDGIEGRYDPNEVMVDYKFEHSLQQTNVRLILPDYTRDMKGTGTEDDTWSAGITLSNSLTGKTATTIDAYLFRWWCSNGATMPMQGLGNWNRKINGQEDQAVFDWAQETVDEILGGLEHRFDEVQALAELDISGDTAGVVREAWDQYGVPVAQRQQMLDYLLPIEAPTMYDVMQSLTVTANDPQMKPARVDKLLRIGGHVPSAVFDTLKARIWSEGHTASPKAANPYQLSPR